jgi:hypothetical protein
LQEHLNEVAIYDALGVLLLVLPADHFLRTDESAFDCSVFLSTDA